MKTFKEYISEESNNEETPEKPKTSETIYPGGVYISVKPDDITQKAIMEYQEKYLKQFELNTELHCTLIYSKKPYEDEIIPESYTALASFSSFELFGPENDTLVIKLNSEDLKRRNEDLTKKYGFISDYDEYKPHITLAYGIKNIDLNSLPDFEFGVILQDESVEALDNNWKDKNDDYNEDDNFTSKYERETLVGKAMSKYASKNKSKPRE